MLETTNRLAWKCGLPALGLALALAGPAFAQDPPGAEQLPQPRESAPEVIHSEAPLNPAYYRASRYDIWQFYAVDRFGRFRLRVVLSPYGAYYLYNGQRFPWVSTHMGEVTTTIANDAVMMPYAED
jgi:hypothetical protein